MNQVKNLSDEALEQMLENCSIEPSSLNHQAHLRLAWVYILKYGVDTAVRKLCKQILDFDKTSGTGRIFHKTLTSASLHIVHQYMLRAKSNDITSFLLEFPELSDDFKALLGQYYSPQLLAKTYARKNFVKPDLRELDGSLI